MSIETDYITAIDIIARGNYNPFEIALELAKVDPSMFLKLAKCGYNHEKYGEVGTLMAKNQKVNAIKKLRDIESLSLREAKDIMDNVQDAIYLKKPDGQVQPYSNDDKQAATLSYAHQKIADSIVSIVH